MNLSRYRCPNCHESHWATSSILWKCQACGHEYPCVRGIPRLYVESALGRQDKALRDWLYDGFLGTYYQYVMPFLSLPARPARAYWKGWVVYVLIVAFVLGLVAYLIDLSVAPAPEHPLAVRLAALLPVVAARAVFVKHPYLF